MSLLLLFGGGVPAGVVDRRAHLTLTSSTRGAVALAVPTRHSLTHGRYGSAIVGSPFHIAGQIIVGDVLRLDNPQRHLTSSAPSRGSLTHGRYGSAIVGSPYHIAGQIIVGDVVRMDSPQRHLTPSAPTRGALTPI